MTGIDYEEDRLELFPTLVFRRKYAGLDAVNEKLRAHVLEREAAETGVVLSNVGGWHSKQDLLKDDHPAITVLLSLIKDAAHAYVAERLGRARDSFALKLQVEGWANVSRKGDYARPHVHPNTNFAVVYYVDAGDAPPARDSGARSTSGALELLDPRGRPEMFQTPGVDARDSVSFQPKSGLMLVFPAWTYHYVHAYQGERPRISIASNVTVRELIERPGSERETEVAG